MTNPFEDPDATYLALINHERQYSLWPAYVDVPDGWNVVHPEASRASCLEYIEIHWTDMRPQGLIDVMDDPQ